MRRFFESDVFFSECVYIAFVVRKLCFKVVFKTSATRLNGVYRSFYIFGFGFYKREQNIFEMPRHGKYAKQKFLRHAFFSLELVRSAIVVYYDLLVYAAKTFDEHGDKTCSVFACVAMPEHSALGI